MVKFAIINIKQLIKLLVMIIIIMAGAIIASFFVDPLNITLPKTIAFPEENSEYVETDVDYSNFDILSSRRRRIQ